MFFFLNKRVNVLTNKLTEIHETAPIIIGLILFNRSINIQKILFPPLGIFNRVTDFSNCVSVIRWVNRSSVNKSIVNEGTRLFSNGRCKLWSSSDQTEKNRWPWRSDQNEGHLVAFAYPIPEHLFYFLARRPCLIPSRESSIESYQSSVTSRNSKCYDEHIVELFGALVSRTCRFSIVLCQQNNNIIYVYELFAEISNY